MQEIDNKKFFRNYAFFMLILLVIFGILLYFVLVARKSWTKNLAITVQTVLDEEENGRWKVGDNIPINSPLTVNCAAYEITDSMDKAPKIAVIIRIMNYYGPIPAVYILNEDTRETQFIAYSSLHGKIRNQFLNNKSDKRREYWQEKIPDIIYK